MYLAWLKTQVLSRRGAMSGIVYLCFFCIGTSGITAIVDRMTTLQPRAIGAGFPVDTAAVALRRC